MPGPHPQPVAVRQIRSDASQHPLLAKRERQRPTHDALEFCTATLSPDPAKNDALQARLSSPLANQAFCSAAWWCGSWRRSSFRFHIYPRGLQALCSRPAAGFHARPVAQPLHCPIHATYNPSTQSWCIQPTCPFSLPCGSALHGCARSLLADRACFAVSMFFCRPFLRRHNAAAGRAHLRCTVCFSCT